MDKDALETAYFRLDETFHAAFTACGEGADPTARARCLRIMAAVEDYKAALHPVVFGPDPMDDEGGRDLAASLALSAVLLRLLAATEDALAEGRKYRPSRGPLRVRGMNALLVDLSATNDRETRAGLLFDLVDAVVGVVGGQAAEALAVLANLVDTDGGAS